MLDAPDGEGEEWSPVKSIGRVMARSEDTFFVKGPMGKGLQVEERGIHLAFCAGTGVLVYLDLVGHLILRNSLPFIRHNSAGDKKSHLSQGSYLPSNISDFQRPKSSDRDHTPRGNNEGPTGSRSTPSSDDFPEQAYQVLSDQFQFHLYVSF